jgi:hypothetical protein
MVQARLSSLLCVLLIVPGAGAAWLEPFSSDLTDTRRQLQRAESALAALGQPMIGNTAPEFGIQHRMLEVPPPESPFVQMDLGASRGFDTVALIPAVAASATDSAWTAAPSASASVSAAASTAPPAYSASSASPSPHAPC